MGFNLKDMLGYKSSEPKETPMANEIKTETSGPTKVSSEVLSQLDSSKQAIVKIRDDSHFPWNEREALFLGRLQDIGSSKAKSRVNTEELVNIVLDGASRVMAQFPTGKIVPTSGGNAGSAALMNLVFQKYIVPNANSQFNFLTKLRLWDVYSRVYGSMPALVDFTKNGDYIGPDIWLISPHAFYPQANVYSINDMDYCFIENMVSLSWLKEQKQFDTWKNIDLVIKKFKEEMNSSDEKDFSDKSYAEEKYGTSDNHSGKHSKIRIITRYERGRWITFVPNLDGIIIREIDNPHKNNKLPIIMKQCYPLLDRLYGLAEFERGKSLQYASNSLVNLYLDGVKFSIFPPTISTKNGVVKDSMSFKPAAHWQEIIPNSIRQLNLSPQGINTFTQTITFLKSSMLNMAATTDTSVSSSTDPGMGKTPQALRMQSSREGARDSWDRYMMEQAIQEMSDRFIDIMTARNDVPIPLMLFEKEIEQLRAQYPDDEILDKIVSAGSGEFVIEPDDIKGSFRFEMDAGTSLKKDEAVEHESIRDLIMLATRIPGGLEQISQTGSIVLGDKVFDFTEAMKRFVITSGVTDSDKIIREALPEDNANNIGLGALAPQAGGGQPASESQPTPEGVDLSKVIPGLNM